MTIYLPKTRTWSEALAGGVGKGFSAGVTQGLEEKRKAKAQEPARKQEAINNAYKRAQESLTNYMEYPEAQLIPDPNNPNKMIQDPNPWQTARAIAAADFDRSMEQSGFPDVTFLSVSGTDTEKTEVEGDTPPFPKQFESKLGPEAPSVARGAEQVGAKIRPTLQQLGQSTAQLPSRIAGAAGTGYNALAGATTGLTGQPQSTIPQPYMDLMNKGQLFANPLQNIQQSGQALGQGVGVAGDFYKDMIQKIMTKYLSRQQPTP